MYDITPNRMIMDTFQLITIAIAIFLIFRYGKQYKGS